MDSPVAEDGASVTTIAQPEETTDETPVCFVIMPFVEHDEAQGRPASLRRF